MDERQLRMANRRLFDEEDAMASLNVPNRIEVNGIGPHPYREYTVLVRCWTTLKDKSVGENHVIKITVPLGYPIFDIPIATMTSPPVAHVNIYKNGNICLGSIDPSESLAAITLRCIRVVLCDPATYNFASKADPDCETLCRDNSKDWVLRFTLPSPVLERGLA